jgi:hypothetical protein
MQFHQKEKWWEKIDISDKYWIINAANFFINYYVIAGIPIIRHSNSIFY